MIPDGWHHEDDALTQVASQATQDSLLHLNVFQIRDIYIVATKQCVSFIEPIY